MADSPEGTPPPPPPEGTPPPPPSSGPPGPPGQPPAAPPGGDPPKKGLSPLAWVLIVLGVILVLMMGSCVACGVVGMRMVRDAAQDFEDNPTKAAAEMMVRVNPELELVDSDDEEGTLTIRNRETGEEATVDFSEITEGRFSFSSDEGESSMTLGEEGITATGPAGEVSTFGAGSMDNVPDWVVRYPGAEIQGVGASTDAEGGAEGTFQMTTEDTPETVVERLEELLEDEGYEITSTASGATTMLSGRQDDSGRTQTFIVQSAETGSVIISQYSGRR